MIEIKSLSKSYPGEGKPLRVLDEINLKVEAGECFGLIGTSGAGKSTLLHCINLLESPTRGEIWVDGVNLSKLDPKALQHARQTIAMIFQHFNLVNNLSVYDNVVLPLKLQHKPIVKAKVDALLELVGMSHKRLNFPSQLSGGQKQRVAIARALVTEPKLLLCDEATSALDSETTHSILTLLKQINREFKLSIVLITHELDVIKSVCDRFAVLEKGRIKDITDINCLFTSETFGRTLLLESLSPTLPDYLNTRLQQHAQPGCFPLCKIIFLGELTQEPLISELSHHIGIKINILQANVDAIADQTFGILVVQLIGDEAQVKQAFDYFSQQQLDVEVLGYV